MCFVGSRKLRLLAMTEPFGEFAVDFVIDSVVDFEVDFVADFAVMQPK